MMPYLWTGLIATLAVAAWVILRRPVRHALEDLNVDRAREQFRLEREGLEARFLIALNRLDAAEGQRWEDANWHDEVVWARDRRTRQLLALVGVDFESDPFSDPSAIDIATHRATALFEYRKGHWHADGKRLDMVGPHEVFRRHNRLEPVVLPQRRA
jgi:hypothetical protein